MRVLDFDGELTNIYSLENATHKSSFNCEAVETRKINLKTYSEQSLANVWHDK